MGSESFGNNPENNITEKQKDFSEIDYSKFLKYSENIQQIRQKEYIDNTNNIDNKVTIPTDLKDYFSDDEIVKKENNTNEKLERFKKDLYEKLGLSEILEENTDMQKFEKGLLDGGFLDNIEMLDYLVNSSLKEIIGIMKQLSNWETIKAILIDLYDSIEDITKVFTEPYAGGMALGALGIGPISKSLKGLKISDKLGKIKENNLFDSKKYDLKSDNKLDEILKRIDENDIIGEGENAIIINHPDNDKLVIKVAKEGMYVDDIIKERNTHQLFLDTYREGLVKGKIDKNVKIPEIFSPKNLNSGYFYIEKIEGQNLFTKYHLDLYKDKQLSKYNLPDLEDLTDSQFLKILKKEKLAYAIPSMNLGDVGMWGGGSTLQVNMMLYTNKFQKENMKKTIEYFEQNGLIHTDFHSGNIMIDKNKKNFIIDFGNTNK